MLYNNEAQAEKRAIRGDCVAMWAGCEVRRLDVTDSTNRQARLWAREGAPHGAVVIARQQTQGRGRRGRDWISAPDAGLWFSMVLRPQIAREQYTLLPFAAALATADACQITAGALPDIKWPNDLLLGGRKVTGILVEGEGDAAILGIGINVRQRQEDFPEELRDKAGSLEMVTGRAVDLPALEGALMAQIERRIDHFDFLREYQERCVTIGAQVRVVAPTEVYEGMAEAMDDTGALLVRDATGGLRRVLAGDVSIRGMMGYV